MTEFYTTGELAALLRVKQRKIYDLVAQGALPVRKVTGKLLFPRDEISLWLEGSELRRSARKPFPTIRRRSQPAATIPCWIGRCANRNRKSPASSTARWTGCAAPRKEPAWSPACIFRKRAAGTSRP